MCRISSRVITIVTARGSRRSIAPRSSLGRKQPLFLTLRYRMESPGFKDCRPIPRRHRPRARGCHRGGPTRRTPLVLRHPVTPRDHRWCRPNPTEPVQRTGSRGQRIRPRPVIPQRGGECDTARSPTRRKTDQPPVPTALQKPLLPRSRPEADQPPSRRHVATWLRRY